MSYERQITALRKHTGTIAPPTDKARSAAHGIQAMIDLAGDPTGNLADERDAIREWADLQDERDKKSAKREAKTERKATAKKQRNGAAPKTAKPKSIRKVAADVFDRPQREAVEAIQPLAIGSTFWDVIGMGLVLLVLYQVVVNGVAVVGLLDWFGSTFYGFVHPAGIDAPRRQPVSFNAASSAPSSPTGPRRSTGSTTPDGRAVWV